MNNNLWVSIYTGHMGTRKWAGALEYEKNGEFGVMECLTGLWRKKVRSCEVLRWKCIKLIHHGQKYCSSFCLFFWLLFSYSLYRTWSGNDRGKVWKIFFLLNLEYVWVWNKLRIISQRRSSKFLLLHSFLYTKLYLLKSGNIHLEKTKIQ